MTSREMLITFEELLRTTNPDLEFDVTINTDLAYTILTRAQKDYVEINFLNGDTIQDNVNAIRKRSDVLRNIIKRTNATVYTTQNTDGGHYARFNASDYWMFMSGTISHVSFPTNNKGYSGFDNTTSDYVTSPYMWPRIELDLINHYDLQKKIRTINNEPVYKYIPIVLEKNSVTVGEETTVYDFVFYLDKDKYDSIVTITDTVVSSTIDACKFDIVYLAYPSEIHGYVSLDDTGECELASSTHIDIVKIAVDIFLKEYKFLLGQINKKPNG